MKKNPVMRPPQLLFPEHLEDLEYDALDDMLGYALRRAQIGMFVSFYGATLEFDVTPARFTALYLVGANPGIRPSVLGSVLGIARSGVNALADWMEERCLAQRRADKQDGRALGLYLTAKGLRQVEKMKEQILAGEQSRAAALTGAEREELLRLLRKLAG